MLNAPGGPWRKSENGVRVVICTLRSEKRFSVYFFCSEIDTIHLQSACFYSPSHAFRLLPRVRQKSISYRDSSRALVRRSHLIALKYSSIKAMMKNPNPRFSGYHSCERHKIKSF